VTAFLCSGEHALDDTYFLITFKFMGFFSNLFKSKSRLVVSTPLGNFTLAYSKRNRNTWTNNDGKFLLSIRGTGNEPDKEQLNFLANVDVEIQKLDKKITNRFIAEFREAGLETDFTDWKQRFRVVAVGVMMIFQGEAYWNITFEDLKEPHAHFTLFIEGQKTTDFSIDT
jgi:hypothetical protein